jgi:hypothetical protein
MLQHRLLAVAILVALAGCASEAPRTTSSGGRAEALHRAAECIRQHGIPKFKDPVLSANGQVYTDVRAMEDKEEAVVQGARRACQSVISAANWNPDQQPPAPPALVAAGVKAAQCMRQHGLPHYADPTADSPYVPGHGFGIPPAALPAGADKRTPVVHQAMQACRALLDAQIQASAMERLAGQ